MATNCKKALLEWSAKNDQDPKLASVVKLCAIMPPVKKLDATYVPNLLLLISLCTPGRSHLSKIVQCMATEPLLVLPPNQPQPSQTNTRTA